MFENVYHAKAFISCVEEEISKRSKTDEKYGDLFVIEENNPKKKLFIDMGIYNHNQCFRMYMNTKSYSDVINPLKLCKEIW